MKILSVEEMRKLDNLYIDEFGIPQSVLMENASLGAFEVLRKNNLHLSKNILIICGSGNNGGDGIALARKLFSFNRNITMVFLKNPGGLKEAALMNFKVADKLGIPWKSIDQNCIDEVKKEISEADLVIDAIFGTGLDREVKGIPEEIIDAVNSSHACVVSMDIPSGLNGNNGCAMGRSIEADYTVSFGTFKYGHLVGAGRKFCGKLYNCNISFPEKFTENIKATINIPLPLDKRDPTGHKGSFGKALFIAGSENYLGAPFFNTYSFLNCGGGYATLFSTKEVINSVAPFAREVVFKKGITSQEGSISDLNFKDIMETSLKNDVVAIGSGISTNPVTAKLVIEIIQACTKPIIIDGDALTAISENPEILRLRKAPTILTPHIGEFSRLTGLSVERILSDRVAILKDTAKKLKSYIILKDATTIIASPEGDAFFSTTGNSGMGVAGSGDLLIGVLSTTLCTLQPLEACSLAVFIHGYAGDITADKCGEDGVLPSKILENLPLAIKRLRENYAEVAQKYTPQEI